MEKIVFTCESVTPMFMYGADGTTPELRPASIKGIMRFWWRAINGNLSLEELKKQENEIFGSTNKKSSFIIYPIEIIEDEDYLISLTPHHNEKYCSESDENKNCFYKNDVCLKAKKRQGKMYKFNIKMNIKEVKGESNKIIFDENKLKNLFILITHLGGFGQRNRRGFGSIKISSIETKTSVNEIEDLIKSLNNQFRYRIKKKKYEQYPYIRKIEIGRKYDSFQNLLETIGKASHDSKCGKALFKNNDRLASPVYVSVIKVSEDDYRPIITTLNCASEKYIDIKEMLNRQKQFKEAIL